MSQSKPLQPFNGVIYVGNYETFQTRANENLKEGRYYEAVAICCIALEILLNDIFYQLVMEANEKGLANADLDELKKFWVDYTAGTKIKKFKEHNFISPKLNILFRRMNRMRNNVIHPLGKRDYILPDNCKKETAQQFYDAFRKLIEASGGRSQEMKEAEADKHMDYLKSIQRRRKRAR